MSSIPASEIVRIIPNVLSAGGSALVMNGLVLTQSPRVPTGAVLSFPNDGVSVASFFGPSAPEVGIAATYFNGFDGSTQKPSSILFAQYNSAAVPAWLHGGPANRMTLAQLQAVHGSLSVVMDGAAYSASSLNLSGASSYSAAAALIQSALNAATPLLAAFTGSIAAKTEPFSGSIAGNILTVIDSAGTLAPGSLIAGDGVDAGTYITSQLSGVAGHAGTYAVSVAQAVSLADLTASYGLLTVTDDASGTLNIGQVIAGTGVTPGTQIMGYGTGTGLEGTYYVQHAQTVASEAMTASGAPVSVSFDSISGSFVLTSGVTGAASTVAYATGTVSDALYLTEATGATISQGADAATPGAFMTHIAQTTQNWATFMTMFDPDSGVGNDQKMAFATWNNGMNRRFAYVAWDSDITPTLSLDAPSCFGSKVKGANIDGTCAIYDPVSGAQMAAFICGTTASIDFRATNGRTTFAFRGQPGLVAGVTSATVANNLIGNGYNFYGAYATANQTFTMLQPGQVSGVFQWMDSYVNEIWLNAGLQQALVELLVNMKSVPYNQMGYDLIRAGAADPINAAVNFGAIREGVTLSTAQAAEINNAAGVPISGTITAQGWYLQVKDAAPQVRQARQSPPINFWYMDGQSIQKITLNSVLVQ